MAKRGALIVLEGLDRSGKSTQCSRLVSFLQGLGIPVEAWRFPDRSTSMGAMISSYLNSNLQLDDRVVHLLFSANRWEKSANMRALLSSGTTLVVDRYSYSGVAFSAAKGLDLEWCKAPEVGLPEPDLIFYLNIPPEAAASRGDYGNERYERLEFQKSVADKYQQLRGPKWMDIDARGTADDVHNAMKETSLKVVSMCQNGLPLSSLWENASFACV